MQGDLFPVTPTPAPGDLGEFMRRICPLIDAVIRKLAAKRFAIDPVIGAVLSRQASIIDSAKKRHGLIIERALRETLRESNRYVVWDEPQFRVSGEAEALANTQSYEDCTRTTLPYGIKRRTVQIDCIVYDSVELRIAAYEVKRGFGQQHDAGKNRSIHRDLHCIQLLLKSYAELKGFNPRTAASRIVFYYGGGDGGKGMRMKSPMVLKGVDLDDHFQLPVLGRVEAANQYYRDQIQNLVVHASSGWQ